MEERTKFHVGLDVHKDSISVAAAELGSSAGEVDWQADARSEQAAESAGQDRNRRAVAHRVRGWTDRVRAHEAAGGLRRR